VLIVLDLWSKSAVFAWLGEAPDLVPDGHRHYRYPIFGEWFTFMLSRNRGAAFGQLDSVPHLLVGGRVVAGIVLAVLLWRAKSTQPLIRAALVLVLAGALGNLYDNLFLPAPPGHPFGEVRDFIDVYFAIWDWHFPTFNVADSCITVGAVLLLATSFKSQEEDEPEPTPAS